MISSKIQQSAFLFAGTAIGAGMLSLPISSGASGFPPALFYTLFWFLYSLTTMYLLLECMGYQTLSEDSGFISMSKQLSSVIGGKVIQISYTLLLYSVTSVYVIGGGQLFGNALKCVGYPLELSYSAMIFSAIFSLIAMQSVKCVGIINQWLMYFLITAFICMLIFLAYNIEPSTLLESQNLYLLFPSTSIIVLSFASHNLLPTILSYLDGKTYDIKLAIFIGMCIPLVIYLLWNAVIIGSLPSSGAGSILDIQLNHGQHGGELSMLSQALESSGASSYKGVLDKMFMVFGLSAIITSYIGVMLSLKDFIIQATHLQHHRFKNLIGITLVYIPSVIFALYFPHGFSLVLGYAGIIVAYLFGITPVLWALKARLKLKIVSHYPSGLSNGALVVLGALALIIIILQLNPDLVSHMIQHT